MTKTNLLAADFYRAKKDRGLLVTLIVLLGISLFFIVLVASAARLITGEGFSITTRAMLGELAVVNVFGSGTLVFIAAIGIGIFNGGEFSFNTIRNKIVAGNSRTKIYLSQLIVNLAIFFAMTLALFVLTIPLCLIFFSIGSQIGSILLKLLVSLPLYISMVAMITFICMTAKSRSSGLIASLLTIALAPLILDLVISLISQQDMIAQLFNPDAAPSPMIAVLESNPFSMLAKILTVDTSGLLDLLGVPDTSLEGLTILKAVIVAICYGVFFTGLGLFLFKKADIK